MATLYVLQGPDKGRTLKTTDDQVLIGRGSDQVPLTDQTVSRRHAELRFENNGWTLEDLNSANGTYVNGERISQNVRLKHGDQIRVGSTLMVYAGDESLQQLSGPKIPRDMVTLDVGSMDSAVVSRAPSSEDSVVLAAPDTAQAVKSWKVIRELTHVLGSITAPEQLLARVMDIIFEEVDVERGVIFLRDEDSGEYLPESVRFRTRKVRAEANRAAIVASRTIMNHVIESREGVLCSNAEQDERFRSGKSVQNLAMRSVICAPIIARDRVLGVIHLDCPVTQHTYTEEELRLIIAIGYQTGLALENARLVQALVERERLAAAGETVAYLSHSIKNILQGMQAGGEVVERGLTKRSMENVEQGWRIVGRNLDKVYALMLNMLAFSKQREPHLEMMQVNRIVEEVVQLTQQQVDDARIALLTELDENVPAIPVDRDGLHQVLLNLITNAIDAVPRGSGVITVRSDYDPLERRVSITVSDNGPGVPSEERTRIFEPFHSTKGHGGTGLGLAVARKIVQELGGSIELTEPDGGGAAFVIKLPTAEARRAAPGETQGPVG